MAWNIKHPIGRLVSERTLALGLQRGDLAAAMGYRNLNKGIRVLEHFLDGGEFPPEKAAPLRELLGIPAEEWNEAVEATQHEIAVAAENFARERFRPHVHVEMKGALSPLFTQVLAYGARILDVPPEVRALPLPQQVQRVRRLVAEHFAAHHGELPTHGRIVGYTFHATFDHAIAYAPDGGVREPFADPGEEARPQLLVKGKVIPPTLFET